MIYVPYFSNYSLFGGHPCPENNKYYASKSIEMSRVSYLYIRKFFGRNQHIFYSDGASPIGIDYLINFIEEPYEFIPQNSYSYNKDVKIHIRRFDERVIQEQGVNRRIMDYLKFSYFNDLDFLAIDMDALVAYNLYDDFSGKDFGAVSISLNGRSISSYITFISSKQIHDKDGLYPLPDYIDYVIQASNNHSKTLHMLFGGEGAYFRNFCYGNISQVSQPHKTIHEPAKDKLIKFLIENNINHSFVNNFIENIQQNSKIQ